MGPNCKKLHRLCISCFAVLWNTVLVTNLIQVEWLLFRIWRILSLAVSLCQLYKCGYLFEFMWASVSASLCTGPCYPYQALSCRTWVRKQLLISSSSDAMKGPTSPYLYNISLQIYTSNEPRTDDTSTQLIHIPTLLHISFSFMICIYVAVKRHLAWITCLSSVHFLCVEACSSQKRKITESHTHLSWF